MTLNDDLLGDIQRNLRSGDSNELFTYLNRLKVFDARTWHENCSKNQPLVEIKDSVLSSVNVILNLNLEIQDIIEGRSSPDSFYQNHQHLKARMNDLGKLFTKASIWMKTTQQDRWLHHLMKATEDSDEERKKLISLLAKSTELNRRKARDVETIKEQIRTLRAKSRRKIEQRWRDRHSTERTLNAKQKEATEITEGRLVITAGPGSGKTHVLVERIANLINSGAKPSRILMLTFTVKATAEMSARVENNIGTDIADNPVIMNFNSFCKHMVESDFEGFGFEKMPMHIDPRMRRYLFEDLTEEGISEELVELIEQKPDVIDITLKLDDLLHNRSTKIEDVLTWFEEEVLTPSEDSERETIDEGGEPSKDLALKRLTHAGLRLITPLRRFIRNNNGLTFGDQITLFHTRLKNEPAYLEKICSDYDHALVDEFQDNNQAQGEIIKLMSEHLTSTCVVGDPNQAIFGFRGANVRNLQDFMLDFAESGDLTKVDLDTCYRHSQQAIDYSEELISLNQDGIERPEIKSGWINSDSTEINVQNMIDEASEAVEHGKVLKRKNLLGYEWDEMAVLARSLNYVSKVIGYFDNNDIPYVTTSSSNLFREEITIEAGMILRACIDPVGNAQAIGFLLKSGFMGVTREDAEILTRKNRYHPQGLFDSLTEMEGKYANQKTILAFYEFINSNKKLPSISMEDWLFSTMKGSGIISKMIEQGANSSLSKFVSLLLAQLSNAGEFFRYPNRFANYIKQLMEGKIELEIEQVSKPGHVVISTIHKAKGLEWPIVVMPSLDHRKPPPTLNPEKAERLIVHHYFNENVEEEQEKEMIRIFYVGLTRVQDLIRLSRPLTRSEKSTPNTLFSVGAEIFGVENVDTIYPSIMQNPLSVNDGLLLNLRTRLEDSIGELRHGLEIEDLTKSIRALLIYHLEQLVVNEHSIDQDLRKLVQHMESLVGRVEYHEFTGETEVSDTQDLWRPKRYTWSMLDAYRRCPQKFAFSHVHKLVSSNNKSMTVGNLVHEIIENIGSLGKKATGKEFDEIIEVSFRNHVNKLPLLGEKKIEEIKEKVAIWNNSERSKNKVIAIEQGLEFKFHERNFYGKIDRVETDSEGNLRIIDFKTGKANKKPGRSGQEQLLLYAHAWQQNTGEFPDLIAYDFVMEDQIEEKKVDPILLEKGLSRLIPIIEGIDANQFEANPDKQTCQYCDFSGICPERY